MSDYIIQKMTLDVMSRVTRMIDWEKHYDMVSKEQVIENVGLLLCNPEYYDGIMEL